MQTKMKNEDIYILQPIDTLVHLGAGRCSELDDYLTLQPQRVLLVEADPQLAEALQKRTVDLSQVQVVCAAVAGQPGEVTLHRYNLPEANSLHSASGLLDLFPGLKVLERRQLQAIGPATLLEALDLKIEQENRLVIDLPGEELPALQALLQANQLHLFGQLQLHCGREPLYQGSQPAAWVLQWLDRKSVV